MRRPGTALFVALTLVTILGCPLTLAAATPTLVQHVSTASNQLERGNGFIIVLPNVALPNNCLILTLTYASSSSRTVSVVDNNGTNTWVRGPSTNSGSLTTTLYYVLGVKAGTQTITVTFDTSLTNFHAAVSEFYNVATSAAIDGSIATSNATGPSVAAGSFATSTDGDLIYQYAIDVQGGVGDRSSSGITAGAGFSLLSACRILSAAAH